MRVATTRSGYLVARYWFLERGTRSRFFDPPFDWVTFKYPDVILFYMVISPRPQKLGPGGRCPCGRNEGDAKRTTLKKENQELIQTT